MERKEKEEVMGTPTLEKFSVKELVDLFRIAKMVMKGNLIQALEQLRLKLAPLAQWLDIPIQDSAHNSMGETRAMFVFKQFGTNAELPPIGLSRDGKWTLLNGNNKQITSNKLSGMIVKARIAILTAFPSSMRAESLKEVETLLNGIPKIVIQAAFLEYLKDGFHNIEETIKKRMERLQVMLSRIENLRLSASMADPIEHRGGIEIPGYAVFFGTPQGKHSRISGTYLTKKPVEDEVQRQGRDYFVLEEPSHCQTLFEFLDVLETSIKAFERNGVLHRGLFSKEEKTVVKTLLSTLQKG